MDTQAVKDAFARAKQETSQNEAKRLEYSIRGAIDQKRAKEDLLRSIEKERRQVQEDIAALDTALVAAEQGDAEPLNEWWARRPAPDPCCAGKTPDRDYPQARPAETVHVHVNR